MRARGILRAPGDEPPLTEAAGRVRRIRSRGASFFGDLNLLAASTRTNCNRPWARSSPAGSDVGRILRLRALVWAARGCPAGTIVAAASLADGRPSPSGGEAVTREEAVALQAWPLLRRYGVIFRRLLNREANAATWRELARVYRRLEARGEIRSGRFVTGMSGEQFALPDAVRTVTRGSAHPGRTAI